jgi:hypothetical protein
VLHQIFQEAGGDPVQALQIAAQKGIPGAQQQWAQIQQQQATLADTQNEVDNRNKDNVRADTAATLAQKTADEKTKESTWEKTYESPALLIQRNGLGKYDIQRKETGVGAGGAPVSDADKEAYAKEVALYHQPYPTAGSRGLKALGMSLPELLVLTKKYNPKATGQGYVAAQYFIGKGDGAGVLQSQDAASQHLAQYLEAVDAYKGTGDIGPLNKVAVALDLNTGKTGPAVINTIAGVLGPEIAKGLIKSGGGVQERLAKEKQLTATLADSQKIADARAYMGLLYGQRKALQQRYLSSLPGTTADDFDAQFPLPDALQQIAAAHAPKTALTDEQLINQYSKP